jgi:glycosyltransferase involved in cell wall biosynthesis
VHIVVLTPVLDDWIAARELLSRLDSAFAAKADTVSVLIVDDGSSEKPPEGFGAGPYARLREISVLRLKKNLGHQRAIAVGLCHIADKVPCDAVVVMDADGQDDPHDAVRLVEKLRESDVEKNPGPPIIFAERTRRSESFVFRLGYLGYRVLHYALTGRGIRFGNFSVIPRARLGGLTVEPMLWNHYAASVVGARLPIATIPSHREARIAGQSRLSFVKLVIHGLSALSCYSETIGVRLLLISSLLFALSVLAIIVTLYFKLVLQLALPGWTSLFAGILIVFLFQVITLATTFTMQMIGSRGVQPFLPARDYTWYIERVDRLISRQGPE